jgi:hypothetical protein
LSQICHKVWPNNPTAIPASAASWDRTGSMTFTPIFNYTKKTTHSAKHKT